MRKPRFSKLWQHSKQIVWVYGLQEINLQYDIWLVSFLRGSVSQIRVKGIPYCLKSLKTFFQTIYWIIKAYRGLRCHMTMLSGNLQVSSVRSFTKYCDCFRDQGPQGSKINVCSIFTNKMNACLWLTHLLANSQKL